MAQAASTAGDNARFNSYAGSTTSWRISAGNNMVFQTRRSFFVRGKRVGKPAEGRRSTCLFEQIATPSSVPDMRAGAHWAPEVQPAALARA